MTRVVSLFLPTWPTDRIRRNSGDASPPPDQPLVLVGRDGSRRIVQALDAAAHGAGLRVGMPVAKAQVLVPGLLILDGEPDADAAALERLAIWMLQRYAPVVASAPPDGIVIDTTGSDHLHGGEGAMLADMIHRLSGSGIAARTAVADTWGAAHAVARYAGEPISIVEPGKSLAAISPLPVAALRLSSDIVAGLQVLGFRTTSDLFAQPRAPLTLRFGPELGRRIDQAVGDTREPIDAIRPPDMIEVRRAFAEPIGAAETIARYIGKLVTELCKRLEERGVGVRRLDLVCHRVDNRVQAIRVGTALPVRDTKRLTRLVCDKIETIEPGFGIEIMTLAATAVEPFEQKQQVTSLIDDPVADVSGLVDILTNRVGEQRLFRVTSVASDVPERSVARIPAMAPETEASWPGCWPRPSRLLAKPEAIDTVALLPDHPPVSFTWRGIRRRVRRADGPERVFGEWWKRDAELIAVRDYFQVEDDAGERFWIFRSGDGENADTGSHRWFLHGIFG
ncbi:MULTISPECIES: Y-family DNA polymerase [unclassified Mesorhizobium]|uniref:Y-family DNA polymerase n=1 Tax=unclassified Mesorhizobium TaxID=325217 RepID=UPI003015424A